MTVPEGTWGPTVTGKHAPDRRRVLLIAGGVLGGISLLLAVVAFGLYRIADRNLDKVDLPSLADKERDTPLNVLVVGSDSREGLTEEQIRRYHLGSFEGQRGDTVILVSIAPGNEHVSVVSFPRDLLVLDDGRQRKLTETFDGGPENVVEVLQQNTGVPIHHYVEVSIPGFISVVEAVDGVRICLDEPLRDEKSGSDFDAGCHEMTPAETLAFVRARRTERGDFDRIDRQQQFMRALLAKLVSTRTLVDVPRLVNVIEQVSRNVTTDDGLGLGTMRTLATELRGLAEGEVPMVTVPSYTATIEGTSYVIPYDPGAEALYDRLTRGVPLEDRGTKAERAEVDVAVWHGGQPREAERAQRTLFWAAFPAFGAGEGPITDVTVNTVLAAPGREREAGWVAALLGGVVVPTPADVDLPDGAEVVVITAERADNDLGVNDPGEDAPSEPLETAPLPPETEEPVAPEAPPSEEPTTAPSEEPAPEPTPTESSSSPPPILPTAPTGDPQPEPDATSPAPGQPDGGAQTPTDEASSPPPTEPAGDGGTT